MTATRAVWILDCSIFVEYLERYLEELSPTYPWLGAGSVINKTWNWQNFQEGRKSRKDELIDWIFCKLMYEFHYMDIRGFYRNELYETIFYRISNGYDLEQMLHLYIPIPRVYQEQITYVVTRSCGTLFIQFETEPQVRQQYLR